MINKNTFVAAYCLPLIFGLFIFNNNAVAIESSASQARTQCTAEITLEMGQHKLKVDRSKGGLVKLSSGDKIDLKEDIAPYGCDIKNIEGAVNIAWPFFSIIQYSDEKTEKEVNEREARRLIKLKAKYEVSKLPTGIEKISNPSADFYVYSNDLIKTYSHQPVLFTCTNGSKKKEDLTLMYCSAFYKHPSGLYLSYSFKPKDFSVDTFVNEDTKQRSKLENLLTD